MTAWIIIPGLGRRNHLALTTTYVDQKGRVRYSEKRQGLCGAVFDRRNKSVRSEPLSLDGNAPVTCKICILVLTGREMLE